MANVNLTQQDIDYIARAVDTEVPGYLARTNPEQYDRMVRGVVDTVTNRMASGEFPTTVSGVLNQNRQFSKITGPRRLDPYGSIENTPRANPNTKALVADHIAGRAAGDPTTIGGALNYANPNFSSERSLTGWINPMIERGAQLFGAGKNIHVHGTAPGLEPAGDYQLSAEGMPGSFVPTPFGPDTIQQSQMTGGILSAINPTMPDAVERQSLPAVTASDTASPQNINERMGILNAYSQPVQEPQMANMSVPTRSVKTVSYTRPEEQPQEAPLSSLQPQQVKMSLAEQYNSYGAGKQQGLLNSLLSQDVAEQTAMNNLKQGLLAQKTQLAAGVNPMDTAEPWKQPDVTTVQPPEVQQVQTPEMAYAPVAQPTQAFNSFSGGMLSPQEQQAFNAQRAFLSQQPTNSAAKQKAGNFAKGLLGAVGGGLLGGLTMGPLGGVLGAALGKSALTGRLNTMATGYPQAPNRAGSVGETGAISKNQLNEQGRNAYGSSGQFRDAVNNGDVGLY